MYAIPDPAGFPNNTNIPASQVKTIMDCSSGTIANDWYASGHPTAFDRGVRNYNVTNDFDAPSWASPAPDGLGRWTWGDSNYNTGCWIDGPNKYGFITVPSLASGRAWYETSTLHCDSRSYEIQVFDPAAFGEAIRGTRPVWNVKPASRWVISLPGMGAGCDGNAPWNNVGGATFDIATKRLYVFGIWSSDYSNRIYVFDVNC